MRSICAFEFHSTETLHLEHGLGGVVVPALLAPSQDMARSKRLAHEVVEAFALEDEGEVAAESVAIVCLAHVERALQQA